MFFFFKLKLKERSCFKFKEKIDFFFENAPKSEVVKPKMATMTPKKGKNIRFIIFVSRKKPKDEANLQFYNDTICASVEAFFYCSCLLQFASLEAFFCCSCLHMHILTREGENIEERERERERERDENSTKSEIGKVENY